MEETLSARYDRSPGSDRHDELEAASGRCETATSEPVDRRARLYRDT